jgi:hypothetical protein
MVWIFWFIFFFFRVRLEEAKPLVPETRWRSLRVCGVWMRRREMGFTRPSSSGLEARSRDET